MFFFQDEEAREFFKRRLDSIQNEIKSMTDDEIINCDFDSWIEYMYSRRYIEKIILYEESKETQMNKTTIRVNNDYYHRLPDEQKYFNVDAYAIIYKIFYTGNEELFKIKPSTYICSRFECNEFKKQNSQDYGYFTIERIYKAKQLEDNQNVKDYIDKDWENHFKYYRSMIENVNKEAEAYNSILKRRTLELLNQRKEKADKFSSLSQKLNIPMKLNPNAPNTKPIKLEKINRKPLDKPKSIAQPDEYSISDYDFDNINNIIKMSGNAMEKTARTYLNIYEEELRDLLLATLNTHYENATGETFRKIGKTDILIQFENKAAFIGECKIWHGIKEFEKAVQQLISYSTWRDLKVSLIIFNKENKGFDNILNIVNTWVKDNTRSYTHNEPNVWDCKYYIEDKQIDIRLNIVIFDLYFDVSQIKDKRINND